MFVLRDSATSTALEEIPVGSTRPVRTIGGLTAFRGFVLGDSGVVYILEYTSAGARIDQYDAGSVTPSRTIVRGLHDPSFMRLDEAGNLYVLDAPGTLLKYAPGSLDPALTITLNHCGVALSAVSLAVDSFGTIYALCGILMQPQRQTIYEYDGNASVARVIHVPQAQQVLNLTTDLTGRLYVEYVKVGVKFAAGVLEYDRHAIQPDRSYPLPSATGVGPVFYDRLNGDLIESSGGCTSFNGGPWKCESGIYVVNTTDGKVVATIAPPPKAVFGLPSLDENGNLYVDLTVVTKSTRNIREYPAGRTSDWQRLLSGSVDLLGVWPSALVQGESRTAPASFSASAGRITASCDDAGTCQARFR